MKFVLNRDRTYASNKGLAVEFKKGVPTHVPPELYQEIISIGGVPEEEFAEDEVKPVIEPTDPAVREAALFEAFEALALRNDPADFTAGGMPRDGVLEKAVGFRVSASEKKDAWLKFQQKED
jgi:hypothetical protein